MKYFTLFILLLTAQAFAKTAARVTASYGVSFGFINKNDVNELKYGDRIPVGAKVMVEDGSTLSLRAEDGGVYHLSSGSFVKFYEDGLTVKAGSAWISLKESKNKVVETTNSRARTLSSGEYLMSFNADTGKSQFLAILGKAEFSNLTDEDLKVKVWGGHFSYVSSDYNSGLPRAATRIGEKSYTQTKEAFANIDGIQNLKFNFEKKKVKRSIASVTPEPELAPVKKSSGIQFVEYEYQKPAKRKIASLPVVKKKLAVKKWTSKSAPVRVFKLSLPKKKKRRLPASVEPKPILRELETVSVFEKSLRKNIKLKPRHKTEVNQLIDELQSYQDDFEKDY